MIETVLTKRKALYKGEVGFFPSNEVSAEDISPARMGEEVVCSFYSPRNLQQLKFLWALVHKTAENTDEFRDKDELMEKLKVRAGYSRMLWDGDKMRFEEVGKSLKRINNEKLITLTNQFIAIVCEEVIPGMKPNDLRREIEAMCEGSGGQQGV